MSGERMAGVACDDRQAVRRSMTGLLTHTGFEVAGEAESWAHLCDLVRTVQPTVAVVTLPVVGMASLAAVSSLRTLAPACEIVVLSAFQQLQLAASTAGARALVAEEDPQALLAVLRDIAARARAADPVLAPRDSRYDVPSLRTGSGTSAYS